MPSEEFMERVLSTGRNDVADDEFDVELEDAPLEEPEDRDPGDEQPEEPDESGVGEEPDEEPEGEPEEQEAPEEDDEEPETPAAVHEDEFYLGRYKSREEAEQGWLEKEQMISRQGDELAQIRQQMAELSGYVQGAVQSRGEEGDFDEWATAHIESGNAGGGAMEALEAAIQTGDPTYVDAYVDVWKQHDPFEAALFRSRIDNELASAHAQARQAHQPPPLQDVINSSWLEVAEGDPDLRDVEIAAGVGKILTGNPALRAAALSGDPELVKSAIGIARDGYKVQSRTGKSGTPRRVKSSDAERLREDKLAASVTTGDSAPERGESTPEVPAELKDMMSAIQRGDAGFPKLRE